MGLEVRLNELIWWSRHSFGSLDTANPNVLCLPGSVCFHCFSRPVSYPRCCPLKEAVAACKVRAMNLGPIHSAYCFANVLRNFQATSSATHASHDFEQWLTPYPTQKSSKPPLAGFSDSSVAGPVSFRIRTN